MNDLINLKKKVIVSFMEKRINNVHKSKEILFNNIYKLDKIILNLTVEEFPKKNLELPKNILILIILKFFGYIRIIKF